MMKRILAILNNKLDEVKKGRTIRRVNRSIETAIDNAQDAIEDLELKIDEIAEKLSNANDINGYIQNISDKMDSIEEQKATIARLNKIRDYFNEEIDIKEGDK